jgi:hypothetical protein
MAEMDTTVTVAIVFDYKSAASSHWISMAEAALDYAWPSWRTLPTEERQSAKEDMMAALFDAGRANPVGERNGIERPSPFNVRAVK